MSSEFQGQALVVDGLSKCFQIYKHPRDRLLQGLLGNRKKLYREFWAVREVSFALAKGETLGIVGRNGSGKSTLLQLICGTLQATRGHVNCDGRIGALLELGSGFNPEFSGLDNIFLTAALLGMSTKEVDSKLDAILEFADIGEFLGQPVKTYSSGMAIRLAFAIQAFSEPDLLVIDEALAVGDELFQKKCHNHIQSLKENGTSMLLVTHSCPDIILHCDRALWLHQGCVQAIGLPRQITVAYQSRGSSHGHLGHRQQTLDSSSGEVGCAGSELSPPGLGCAVRYDPEIKPVSTKAYPVCGASIESVRAVDANGAEINLLDPGELIVIEVEWQLLGTFVDHRIICSIHRHDGVTISGQSFLFEPEYGFEVATASRWKAVFQWEGRLWPGIYLINAAIRESGGARNYLHRIVDAMALRVLPVREQTPIGTCNLAVADVLIEQIPLQSKL